MYQLKVHHVKSLPHHFEATIKNQKPYEVRIDDRAYRVNDLIQLHEWTRRDGYTGRVTFYLITHKLSSYDIEGLKEGWCALGLGPLPQLIASALFLGQGVCLEENNPLPMAAMN